MMRIVKRAFTLIELLVVIAIIAILAAILFPVFAQAKAAALKTKDISNFKQIGIGTMMYVQEFDESYPMSNSGHHPSGWGFGPPDKVWGVAVMPYVKNEDVWICPTDGENQDPKKIYKEHAATVGWNVNTMTAEQKLYARMVRSNMGMNYVFFSPWRQGIRVNYKNTSATVTVSEVESTSNTIFMANSVWDRRGGSGRPMGGGNWVIEAPCAQDANGAYLKPISQYNNITGDGSLFSYSFGWADPTPTITSYSWLVYGGMWPFHNQRKASYNQPGLMDGTVIIGWADGSVRPMNVKATAQGCRAYGNLGGKLTNKDLYLWDLE